MQFLEYIVRSNYHPMKGAIWNYFRLIVFPDLFDIHNLITISSLIVFEGLGLTIWSIFCMKLLQTISL